MTDAEIEIVKHLDEVNKVVEEYLKGNDPTKISKTLSLPRTRVVAHLLMTPFVLVQKMLLCLLMHTILN
jgi:hypothetical protein